jgi:hypothetical protein
MAKVLRCECGTAVISADDAELVLLAIDHGWRVHGMHLTPDEVLAQAEPVTSPQEDRDA